MGMVEEGWEAGSCGDGRHDSRGRWLQGVDNCGGEGVGVLWMVVGQEGCGELYSVVVIR